MTVQDVEKVVPVQGNTIFENGLEAQLTRSNTDGGDDAQPAIERQRSQAAWDGPDDPENPLNWPSWRKIVVALCVSLGQLATLMSASIVAAALPQISRDIGLGANATQIAFSVFFLGLATGPFPVAALSEMYGRKPVWLVCNCSFILWSSLCPVGDKAGLLIVGRFMIGASASVGLTLTGPIMADMYPASERGKSLAIAGILTYLGPALGPIVGGIVSQYIHWHWLFWVLSFFIAAVTILGFFVIRETYAPILLYHRAAARDPSLHVSESPLTRRFWADLSGKLRFNLLRPVKLMLTRPVIPFIGLMYGVEFGIYTLMLSTFAVLWIDRYHQSETVSSLHYISIAAGIWLAAQLGGYLMDWIYKRLRQGWGLRASRLNMGVVEERAGVPEFRAPYMMIGGVMMPIGLLWYGWAAERRATWVAVDLGALWFTFGGTMYVQGALAYTLDEFETGAASAQAGTRMLSQLAGFCFPLFAPQLYGRLGYGWGNSVLALVALLCAVPMPFILWFWGEKLRAKGRDRVVF